MNIYTSYFGNLKNIQECILPLSIARFSPKWFDGHRLEYLAPPKKLLWKSKQGKINNEQYAVQYFEAIEKQFDQHSLYLKLQNDYSDQDIAFICFEKKDEFCHRRLLANWLEQNLNIEVKEL